MAKIKLTAKRQATFPVEVCHGLGVEPGDEIELVPMLTEEGERIRALKKASKSPGRDSLGCLNQFAGNASAHSMDAIRKSIAEGRQGRENIVRLERAL